MQVIAIVPARGGSKGIPRKNLVPLGGIPLIDHTLRVAKSCAFIDLVILSSDDPDILNRGQLFEVCALERDASLATDETTTDKVIENILTASPAAKQIEPATLVILLQPTSPLRTQRHIYEAYCLYKDAECSGVISVFCPEHHPAKAYKLDDQGGLTGYYSPEAPFLPRQSLPEALYPNGAIFIFSAGAFLENNCIPRYGNKPYVMSREESIDIDSPADIAVAESAIEKRNNNG